MSASRVVFRSEGYGIEGRLAIGGACAVVVTHPHPLYGGDMDNDVVTAIAEAFEQTGHSTLRFNFRGVGRSEGRYSDGSGEQEDVCAAVDYLKDCGYADVALSGYSFGTWVNALCAGSRLPDIPMTMVAPPAAFMDFGPVSNLTGLKSVVTGSRDDIAPPDMLKRLVAIWNPDARLEILSGADHFFFGYREALIESLVDLFSGGAAGDTTARIS